MFSFRNLSISRSAAILIASGAFLFSGARTEAQPPQSTPNASSSTIIADFGGRATRHAIPGSWIGVGAGGTLRSNATPLMASAGLNYTRFHALIQLTYKTTTPNWSLIDSEVAAAQAAGLHVILEMDFAPPWLLPSPNPCSGYQAAYAYPKDLGKYAALNAAYVKHMDAKFPGVVTDYEIWNEPDGGGLCAPQNTRASRLSTYLSIYGAVAPAIRNAAAQDGQQVRIGGPTLGSPAVNANTWIPAFLSDSRTAPYVDFVSYHDYPTGTYEVQHGMTWSGVNGTPSLYARTQSGGSGLAAYYKQIAAMVVKGSQPNAYGTPVYLDEFNSDYSFSLDCCRNSPVYAPLWNGLVMVDLLNTIYTGAANVPGKVLYYAVSNAPFCIAGVIDASMDCKPASGTPQPYPQYYAFDLFASRSFLDLRDGGHMANSVSSTNSTLQSTAFYTNVGDTLVLVNPTGSDYSNVVVVARNSGYSSPHATLNLLNSHNPSITTETVGVISGNGGYQSTVTVPAYSVVAVTFHN